MLTRPEIMTAMTECGALHVAYSDAIYVRHWLKYS